MSFGEFLFIFLVLQVLNLVAINTVVTVRIDRATSRIREAMVEHMLYVQSLSRYNNALQDLKDKEMFDLINKERKEN